MKRFLIFFLLFFSTVSGVYAQGSQADFGTAAQKRDQAATYDLGSNEAAQLNSGASQLEKEGQEKYCEESKGCLEKPNFRIPVGNFTPGNHFRGGNFEQRGHWFLGNIIQKLMIAFGFIAVLIMTVGAGYIILHNGKDELLNKGKTIFMTGIYAIAIALSSYILISIIRYLIYKQ